MKPRPAGAGPYGPLLLLINQRAWPMKRASPQRGPGTLGGSGLLSDSVAVARGPYSRPRAPEPRAPEPRQRRYPPTPPAASSGQPWRSHQTPLEPDCQGRRLHTPGFITAQKKNGHILTGPEHTLTHANNTLPLYWSLCVFQMINSV